MFTNFIARETIFEVIRMEATKCASMSVNRFSFCSHPETILTDVTLLRFVQYMKEAEA